MDINDSFNNIIDSTVTVQLLPEHKTPTQLTSKLGKDTIVGREKELKEIDTLLKESSSLLLINGIGGIGKSTIASYYLHSQKENLDYYGFFEGLDSFTSELREPLGLQQEKENDAFLEALTKLRKNLKGNKLLVFDDVKNIKDNKDKIKEILALKEHGYKILLTSREEIEEVEQYYLDVLALDDAKELFNSIYLVEDEAVLEEILGYLDCHAFFVEMTAKTLKSKKTLTPEIIKEKFENGEFSTIKRKRKESFNDYLNELFSFDELDDEEILMLKQLSVLPSIEIEFEFLQEIFDKEDDENFEDILNYLCEKGWISYIEGSYKLHQIIVEYIQLKEKILLEDVEIIINFFTLFINSSSIENLLIKKNYIVFIDTIYKVFEKDIENKKIYNLIFYSANFFRILGFLKKSESIYLGLLGEIEKIDKNDIFYLYYTISIIYDLMGEYNQAELYSNKAINYIDMNNEEDIKNIITIKTSLAKIYEQQGKYFLSEKIYLDILNVLAIQSNVGDEIIEHFNIYHSLGILYKSLGKYTLSETYLLKSLKIREDKLDSEPIRVAKIYNSLGLLYYTMEEFKESEKFHLQALLIREKFLGINHAETSTTYNNLGLLYTVLTPSKALDYLFKSLSIRENNLGLTHVRTATIYQNLANFYMMNDKQYVKAISFYEKALNIKKNKLDKYHPEIAFLYRSLALAYFLNKKYMEARKNINQSIQIGKEALSLEHPEFLGILDVYKLINNRKELLVKPKINDLNNKIGRNDPCPCNSGKKYKKCCGKNS